MSRTNFSFNSIVIFHFLTDTRLDYKPTTENIGQQGTNSGNAAVGSQHNHDRRQMNFGSTHAGDVGQQGTNSGNVAVRSQHNFDRRQMNFGSTHAGDVGQQGTNSGNVAVGSQHNLDRRQMNFGSIYPRW